MINKFICYRNIQSVFAVGGAVIIMLGGLSGCAPAAMTSMGIGASTGVNHVLNGIAYRTFTTSTKQVTKATLTALNHMQIKVESTRKEKTMAVIVARTSNRSIEVEVEALSPNTTRMRTVAKDGIFYDSATAAEIVYQTELVLGKAAG